jgi:hypothetical protein
MKGTVLTDPIPNGNRIEFDLFQEDTRQNVWCYSSQQFDKSILIKKGEKIDLDGKCVNDQSTGKLVSFGIAKRLNRAMPLVKAAWVFAMPWAMECRKIMLKPTSGSIFAQPKAI